MGTSERKLDGTGDLEQQPSVCCWGSSAIFDIGTCWGMRVFCQIAMMKGSKNV